jgi:predicted Rossmann fold flavoprotein
MSATDFDCDVLIVGAGAAGLMCAAGAVKRGRRVIVLEGAGKAAGKIRISGGGRANFTNLHAAPENFLSDNPRFCVSALKRYTQHDFIALVEAYGIAYHEKTLGQLFCDGSAQQIIDMLLIEAGGSDIRTATRATKVTKTDGGFRVETSQGPVTAENLVIASGGPSIPKMGASGFGYEVARQFGLNVIEPRPGLVPLTFDAELLTGIKDLAGISVERATVSLGKVSFTEALLFTHRGLSGPAILQISSYWRQGDWITVDLLPGQDIFALLRAARQDQPKKTAASLLAQALPKRLAQAWAEETGCRLPLAETPDRALKRLAERINAWRVLPNGTEGLRTAEVTVGGVDTRALSSKTMQADDVPGLYFIGEAVDVTGHLGGFNFQWAWASGHACGEAA